MNSGTVHLEKGPPRERRMWAESESYKHKCMHTKKRNVWEVIGNVLVLTKYLWVTKQQAGEKK